MMAAAVVPSEAQVGPVKKKSCVPPIATLGYRFGVFNILKLMGPVPVQEIRLNSMH